MFTFKKTKPLERPINVMPGDTINIIYTNQFGIAETLLKQEIDSSTVIDTVKIYSFTNEFELAEGHVCVMGKSYAKM